MEHYAAVAPDPVDLILPASLDQAAALALLEQRLEVTRGRSRISDRTLLDSFDGRLRDAGLRAERPAGRSAAIVLYEPGAPSREAHVPRARRHLATELPDGALRERLAPVLEERALLPAVRVRSSVQTLAVLGAEAKTVARIELERPELVRDGGERMPLAARLSLRPVLGYDREFDRTLTVLRDDLGLEAAERPLYDAAVLAAGGRPEGIATKVKLELPAGTRTDAAAALVLGRLVEVAEVNLPGTLEDLDPEFLHDVRVSIRRARSVLRELKDVHEPEARAHLRDELKWAQALTGPVRDLDVQLLEWPELSAHVGDVRAAELEPLRALLARRRDRERAKLVRGLRGKRFRAAMRAWQALASEPAGPGPDADKPIEAVAGKRIRKVLARMLEDGGKIGAKSPAEALHDLRKRGKELRYLLELFGSVFPERAVEPLVDGLKDLQKVLGRFQDRAVQVETLHAMRDDLAVEPEGPAALIALGPVLDALLADQQAARKEFAAAFEEFGQAAGRKRVRKAFGS
ncbi:MAG TPA: CHAD domain-containing protein [Solirubrobacteraceae bacterium]|nr:CHAD domain-containing protein [Solirubrobacteraceae bacterium]